MLSINYIPYLIKNIIFLYSNKLNLKSKQKCYHVKCFYKNIKKPKRRAKIQMLRRLK